MNETLWCRRSLMAGGLVFALGNALHPLEHTDAAYDYATWEAAHLLILLSIPLLVLGLPTLRGRVPKLAIAATTVGLIGLAPGCVIETFVAPTIGADAMEDLVGGGMGAVDGLFGAAFLGGLLAVAWHARRAGMSPSWAPTALLVATLALLPAMGMTGPGVGVLIIGATVVQGVSLTALAVASAEPRGVLVPAAADTEPLPADLGAA
jgi:hypothetical protein